MELIQTLNDRTYNPSDFESLQISLGDINADKNDGKFTNKSKITTNLINLHNYIKDTHNSSNDKIAQKASTKTLLLRMKPLNYYPNLVDSLIDYATR